MEVKADLEKVRGSFIRYKGPEGGARDPEGESC